jgi:hypothetical protein
MNTKPVILIVDTVVNRRKEIARLWHDELGCDVIFYGAGSFFRFSSQQAADPEDIDVSGTSPAGCLFHVSNADLYEGAIRGLIDRCSEVIVYSGGGVRTERTDLPKGWKRIVRPIDGSNSANTIVWRELSDWLSTNKSERREEQMPSLLTGREPHYLRALHILCQGFSVALRMPARVPASARKAVQSRDWWSVPLLASARLALFERISEEWLSEVPEPIVKLARWISGDEPPPNLPTTVAAAEQLLYERLTM